MRDSNEHIPVPSAAEFRAAIAQVEWVRNWCERENAHDQMLLQALGPRPYPANVTISRQRQDNRLGHVKQAEADFAPIRAAVIRHLVAHSGLTTASERVSLTREMQRSSNDLFLADQLGELEELLSEGAQAAETAAPTSAPADPEQSPPYSAVLIQRAREYMRKALAVPGGASDRRLAELVGIDRGSLAKYRKIVEEVGLDDAPSSGGSC